ncbi:MAG: hypothetical protein H0X62_10025, partial [Bacteroidetes bacterium]|nr:hypothetical protein [Bacteroidota bacterium]
MNYFKLLLPFLITLLSFSNLLAQFNQPIVIGIGTSFIDDDGKRFGFLNFGKWDYALYPSRIHIEQKIAMGLSIEAIGSVNQLRKSRNINGINLTQLQRYYALDGIVKYHLSHLIGMNEG